MASRGPLMLVGSMQVAATGLSDLVALARRSVGDQRREPSYGSIGSGSLYHLVTEDLAARLKRRMTHVPYKGVAPVAQAPMGGQLDLAILPAGGNAVDLVQQGKLRAFGVTDLRRLERPPQVPSFAEAFGFKDFVYEIWGGLFVPSAVPQDLAQRLKLAFSQAVHDAEFHRQVLTSGGVPGSPMTLKEADRLFAEQIALYRHLAQSIGLKPQ